MAKISELQVNGVSVRISADSERSLLSVLREDLDLTGSKYGCGEGRCGACTVWIDGVPKRSCITPMSAVVGKPITTIEGLEKDGRLHPLQETVLEMGAMQCGYCTSGMIMTGAGLLLKNPNPTVEEIVRFMDGNLCRCGTYSRIVPAVMEAAKRMREGSR